MVLEQSHADTGHRVETTALKVMALSSGLHTQAVELIQNNDYPLGGHCAPLLSISFAVRHGLTWVSQSSAALISKLYVYFMDMNIMYDTAMHIASAYVKVWFVWNIVGKCVLVSRMFLCTFPLCTDYVEGIFYFICKKGN